MAVAALVIAIIRLALGTSFTTRIPVTVVPEAPKLRANAFVDGGARHGAAPGG